MDRKLDSLEQDVYGLLKKYEPNPRLWRDIVEELWLKYGFRYSSQRNFGVAVSQKLKSLKDDHMLIVKRGDEWGTMQTKWSSPEHRQTPRSDDLWKKSAYDEASRIFRLTTSVHDEEVIGSPEAVLSFIGTVLPETLRKKLEPETTDLRGQLKVAYKLPPGRAKDALLYTLGKRVVPRILRGIFDLLNEE